MHTQKVYTSGQKGADGLLTTIAWKVEKQSQHL